MKVECYRLYLCEVKLLTVISMGIEARPLLDHGRFPSYPIQPSTSTSGSADKENPPHIPGGIQPMGALSTKDTEGPAKVDVKSASYGCSIDRRLLYE